MFWYLFLSEHTAKSLIPKSIPIFPSLVCLYSFSCSTKIETKYFPICVFEIVKEVRQKTDIPLVFLTYINPVFFYGYEKFFKKCNEYGIDANPNKIDASVEELKKTDYGQYLFDLVK